MDSLAAHYCTLQGHRSTALASPALWTALVDSLPEPDGDDPPTRLALALAPRHARSARGKELRTVLVRAKEASKQEMQEAGEGLPEHVVLLPNTLTQAHSAVFTRRSSSSPSPTSPPSLSLAIVQALPLSSAILVSLDSESYANASDKSGRLESLLAGRDADLVREGDVVDLPGVGRWKVAVTEPVLQGAFVRGKTRLLVLPPAGTGTQDDEVADSGLVDGTEASEDDLLDFDIDDSFLAPSVLPSRRSHVTPLTSPLHSSAQTGKGFPLLAPPSPPHSGTLIAALPLSFPVEAEILTPTPDADEDDLPHALASTANLGRLGLFSGDWALVEHSSAGNAEEEPKEEDRGRLVRVFAEEGLLEGREASAFSAPTLYLPPPLLFNLLGPSSLSFIPSSPASLTLHPAPLISPILPLPIPTASSVTISRLASPHSVNKLFQPLFLEGLKEYFSKRRRVVKRGDVIAVGIDEEKVRFVGEGKGEAAEEDFDLPDESTAPTAVVHFLITALSVDASTSSSSPTGDFDLDRRLEDGLLGCFVDPKVTKLLQTGVERGRVPDDAGWLGIDSSPTVSLAPDSLLGTPTPASRLYDFLLSSLTPRASTYSLPLTVLLKGARGSGKRTLIRSVTRRAGVGLLELDCFDLLGENDAKTEGRLRALAVDKALACAPVVLVLRNVEALARKSQAMETGQEPPMTTVLRDCFATIRDGWKASGHPVVVVATTTDVEKVPTGVLGLFKEEIGIQAPAEPERLAILRNLTSADIISPDVSLRSLAVQTAALVANDLVDLVRRARAAAAERVLELASSSDDTAPTRAPTLGDIANAGVSLTSLDFNSALEKARSAYSESIGAPKIPNVTWDDVGGLANVKSDILDTIQLPLEHPELFADGLKKRSGILLYGPPGTGKTLLAKAVATSCSLNFFSVKGPELLNMYIGESEANVRRVFQRARDAKPCVVFMDELDSVAPKRGNQGDSGGVMDRIVSQLLAELDGMSEGKGGNDVFVIGATNRPDLLDPALLRPGRFDRMLYLGVSNTHQAQLNIIQALTRKFKLAPETDLAKLAEKCTFNLTGADFYALCSDAMLKAMTRKAEEVDKRIAELNAQPPYSIGETPLLTPQYYLAEMATPAEIEVLVAQQDFDAALAELVPSVSQAEMQHYKTVQQRFSAETMNSDDKLAEKEKKEAATVKMNGLVKGPVEKVVPNGLVVDGVQDVVDPEEEKRRKRRAAKGKGKARAD
ncbi:peroxisomal biogenesis factor 6 [Rhodotorula toruloides]|uniref:Peroxisomal ATPase PEX6 n=1 Tax=Rhodotorula toruloides TaxID=5286 RepID=A0A511KLZ9_RHOTO|nr:peroxisomal biogenesis factor 6 [Rhodotorula toruloides]